MSELVRILDDRARVKAVDVHDTATVLAGFPGQCRDAVALVPDRTPVASRPSVIVLAGMGGSASSGDLLAACAAEHLDVPIVVHRGYGLPAIARPGALVILSSYSGETAEVLSAAATVIERRVASVVVTTGGRLAALAAEHRMARVAIPPGLMPRMALGYLFFGALGALREAGIDIASREDIGEALDALAALGTEVAPDRPTVSNEAKRLAIAMTGRLPLIYGGPTTAAVAYRWKTDIEENAKTLAVAGALPEMNHNEIEAWRAPDAERLQLVLLRDRDEHDEIARRFALLREMVGGVAGGMSEASTRGRSRIARVLTLVAIGQWTSYYLAVLRGVDPWTVPRLDELKRRLRADGERKR